MMTSFSNIFGKLLLSIEPDIDSMAIKKMNEDLKAHPRRCSTFSGSCRIADGLWTSLASLFGSIQVDLTMAQTHLSDHSCTPSDTQL
ncbi:hypothetical protein CBS63078_7469 [Aspergillus niger]|nr:hypothetical protein CBS13152_7790 [Aspergillus niger]KAI2898720.1 hypothetical protein CBS63078_7469 [Aspergillus niger]KAI2967729.1 hypothetical protein CBS147323_4634 [Aspergillus niger]KAI3003621.1 hypothetical protein CBS147345_8076 [Aspergillus niger]KAI3025942.1 hypothetical protein CBS147347_5329 [Aspergillus niger]